MSKSIDVLANEEASLHFNKEFDTDRWWACVCCFKAGYKQRSDELKDDAWKQKLAEAFHQRSFEDFRSDEQSIALWMAENLL